MPDSAPFPVRQSAPDSPVRLIVLSMSGLLLAGASFLCSSFYAIYRSLPLLGLSFAFAIFGSATMYWNSYRLRNDVQNERWPEEMLTPFRRIVEHPIWKCAMAVLVVAMFAALIQEGRHHSWFWAVFFLLQAQTQIGSSFARVRKPLRPTSRIEWSTAAPLRSDHWGER